VKNDIIICVYNSIGLIKNFEQFEKIFVDEAHHIAIPLIYSETFEEEHDETESYIDQISMLTKYNNNVYLQTDL